MCHHLSPRKKAGVYLKSLTPKTKTGLREKLGFNLKNQRENPGGHPKKLTMDMTLKIADFCQRDEISCILPGKKRQDQVTIVTKNEQTGEKTRENVPKRLLYISKKEHYTKFISMFPESDIGKSSK